MLVAPRRTIHAPLRLRPLRLFDRSRHCRQKSNATARLLPHLTGGANACVKHSQPGGGINHTNVIDVGTTFR